MTPVRRRWALASGLVLLVAGLGLLGYAAWQYVGTSVVSAQRQEKQRERIVQDWDDGVDVEGVALLRVPRFGADYVMPVLPGFDEETLAQGVGWYDGGALPGETGNLVLAGHRVTKGAPFAGFPELRAGDLVEVETRTGQYTYRLTDAGTDVTVPYTASWPLQPVPEEGAAGDEPTQALLTMITCADLFSTDDRSVVRGILVGTEVKPA